MPKRVCPFEYDLMPQVKVHLTEKDVSVTMETHKKLVQEKTLEKLFKGARSSTDIHMVRTVPHVGHDKIQYKQMFLDSHCHLKHNGTHASQQGVTCVGCSLENIMASTRCNSCDRFLCIDCTRVCQRCMHDICSSCTSSMFSSEDHNLCQMCT